MCFGFQQAYWGPVDADTSMSGAAYTLATFGHRVPDRCAPNSTEYCSDGSSSFEADQSAACDESAVDDNEGIKWTVDECADVILNVSDSVEDSLTESTQVNVTRTEVGVPAGDSSVPAADKIDTDPPKPSDHGQAVNVLSDVVEVRSEDIVATAILRVAQQPSMTFTGMREDAGNSGPALLMETASRRRQTPEPVNSRVQDHASEPSVPLIVDSQPLDVNMASSFFSVTDVLPGDDKTSAHTARAEDVMLIDNAEPTVSLTTMGQSVAQTRTAEVPHVVDESIMNAALDGMFAEADEMAEDIYKNVAPSTGDTVTSSLNLITSSRSTSPSQALSAEAYGATTAADKDVVMSTDDDKPVPLIHAPAKTVPKEAIQQANCPSGETTLRDKASRVEVGRVIDVAKSHVPDADSLKRRASKASSDEPPSKKSKGVSSGDGVSKTNATKANGAPKIDTPGAASLKRKVPDAEPDGPPSKKPKSAAPKPSTHGAKVVSAKEAAHGGTSKPTTKVPVPTTESGATKLEVISLDSPTPPRQSATPEPKAVAMCSAKTAPNTANKTAANSRADKIDQDDRTKAATPKTKPPVADAKKAISSKPPKSIDVRDDEDETIVVSKPILDSKLGSKQASKSKPAAADAKKSAPKQPVENNSTSGVATDDNDEIVVVASSNTKTKPKTAATNTKKPAAGKGSRETTSANAAETEDEDSGDGESGEESEDESEPESKGVSTPLTKTKACKKCEAIVRKALKATHDKAIAMLKKNHQKEIDALKEKANQNVKRQTEMFGKKAEKAAESHEKAIEKLRAKLEKTEEAHSDKIDDLNSKHGTKVEILTIERDDAVVARKAAEKTAATALRQHQEEMKQKDAKLKEETAKIKLATKAEVKDMKPELNAAMKDKMKEIRELTVAKEKLERDLKEVTADAETQSKEAEKWQIQYTTSERRKGRVEKLAKDLQVRLDDIQRSGLSRRPDIEAMRADHQDRIIELQGRVDRARRNEVESQQRVVAEQRALFAMRGANERHREKLATAEAEIAVLKRGLARQGGRAGGQADVRMAR